jgi:SNF2 family DNA or RNA helicase
MTTTFIQLSLSGIATTMPSIERFGDVIRVNTRFAEKEQVKLIPGSRWDSSNKIWTTPLSWAACIQLRGIFGSELQVGPELTQWSLDEFTRRIKPTLELRTLIEPPSGDNRATWLNDNVTLYDFQLCGTRFFNTAGSSLLNDDLGVGKTMQALAALAPDMLPALVICPNSVKRSWEYHIDKFHQVANPYVVAGGAVGRRRVIEQAQSDKFAVVIINIEAVRLMSRLAPYGSVRLARCRECDPRHGDETLTATRCEVHRKELNGFGFKTIILDEAHRIKSPSSKQTRAVWAVGNDSSVTTRWALTGTAIANHIGDLWSILHFIAPDEWPNRSKVIDRYAMQSWNAFGGLDIIGINPDTRNEFFKILDARYRRTPKSLVLSHLPPKTRSTRWVDMTPKQRKAYDELNRRLTTIMADGQPLTVHDNLVKNTRMLQLASSYANIEWIETPKITKKDRCPCRSIGLTEHDILCRNRWKCNVTLTDPSPKLDVLEEIIEESGDKPLVVAAQSAQLIALAAKRLNKLKIPYGRIVGDVSEYERQVALDQFQRNALQVMLITIDAGGEGVNGLQHSDTMVILQRSWKMLANVQLEARVDRIGSEKHSSVHIIDIVTRDSIEETRLYPRLAEKFERLEEIQRDRARLAAAGLEPPEMFILQAEESTIMNSDLGV